MPKKKKRRLKMKDRKTNFDYDLVIGQKGEKLVDHIFKNATVEVKRDFWTGTTGNIAVEFESRGKASGISKTKSDYYAFVLAEQFRDEVIIIIKTSRLKEIYLRKQTIIKNISMHLINILLLLILTQPQRMYQGYVMKVLTHISMSMKKVSYGKS